MSNITRANLSPKRSANLEALMQVEKDRLKSVVKTITGDWQIQPVALPQAGLGLLKLQDGAFHESFYLGEFPVATAHLSVMLDSGESVEGAAVMMSDDIAQVEALALCDAILSHQLAGFEAIRQLLTEGQTNLQQKARKRHAMLGKTRVDFSLLADAGDQNED